MSAAAVGGVGLTRSTLSAHVMRSHRALFGVSAAIRSIETRFCDRRLHKLTPVRVYEGSEACGFVQSSAVTRRSKIFLHNSRL